MHGDVEDGAAAGAQGPLDLEMANEEIPEEGGSSKLPGEGEGEKLPVGAP